MTPSELASIDRLVALGLSVFPIERRGKRPLVRWLPYTERLATAQQLRAWFNADTDVNVGIACGVLSDHVVLDVDSDEALPVVTRHLPYTPRQQRTKNGWHFAFRHPGQHVPNRARIEIRGVRLPIDVRGDHGYVATAPSTHESGVRYELAGDWTAPIEEVPVFDLRWIARVPRPLPNAALSQNRIIPMGKEQPLIERARYLAAIAPPEIGCGSDAATLYAACRLVRGFDLCAADATALLWEWAGGRSGWTHEWIAAKVAHAQRYGTEPRGGLLR